MDLAQLIQRGALRSPDRPAIAGKEQSISYSQLAERVDAAASVLMERGVKPGGVVALGLPLSPLWQWTFLLGAWRAGAVSMVLGSRPVADLRALPGADPHVVAIKGSRLSRLPGIQPVAVSPQGLDAIRATRGVIGLPDVAVAQQQLGLIVAGSKGGGVGLLALDAATLAARAQQAVTRDKLDGDTRLLCLPGGTCLAIEYAVATWMAGGCVVVGSSGVSVGENIANLAPNRMLVTASTLPALLDAQASAGPLASLGNRRLMVAGGPLSHERASQAQTLIAAEVSLVMASPETSVFARASAADLAAVPGCAGTAVEGAAVVAVGPQGARLPASATGMLCARTDVMARAPGALHALGGDAATNGWFLTGLLGQVRPDGRLIVTGTVDLRKARPTAPEQGSRSLLTRGAIEQAVAGLDGVAEVCVLSQPLPGRRSLPVIVYAGPNAPALDQLARQIRALPLGLEQFHVVRVPALLRTAKGGIDREATARAVQDALQDVKARAPAAVATS